MVLKSVYDICKGTKYNVYEMKVLTTLHECTIKVAISYLPLNGSYTVKEQRGGKSSRGQNVLDTGHILGSSILCRGPG